MQRELIDSQDARGGDGERLLALPEREAGALLRATGMGQFQQSLAQAFRVERIAGQHLWKRFHENLTQARRGITTEAAGR